MIQSRIIYSFNALFLYALVRMEVYGITVWVNVEKLQEWLPFLNT
jgi:hypothetical protein